MKIWPSNFVGCAIITWEARWWMWVVWVSPEVKEWQETGHESLHGVLAAERTTTQVWNILFQ
jgi:hypothetical protein